MWWIVTWCCHQYSYASVATECLRQGPPSMHYSLDNAGILSLLWHRTPSFHKMWVVFFPFFAFFFCSLFSLYKHVVPILLLFTCEAENLCEGHVAEHEKFRKALVICWSSLDQEYFSARLWVVRLFGWTYLNIFLKPAWLWLSLLISCAMPMRGLCTGLITALTEAIS